MIITCSITWHVPTSLSLHTLSIEVSTRVSSIIQNQTRAFTSSRGNLSMRSLRTAKAALLAPWKGVAPRGLVHPATLGGVTSTSGDYCLDPHQGAVTKLLLVPVVARFPSFRIPHRTEHPPWQGGHPKLLQELALMTRAPGCQRVARGRPTSGLASGEPSACHLLQMEYLG